MQVPVHHAVPVHHEVTHKRFKGYAPPHKGGGSLEEIFGVHTKYHPAPPPVVHHVPEPVYHEPEPVYHEPEPVYVPPKKYQPDYSHPTGHKYKSEYVGHPFSMEMVFGLPLHKSYMHKLGRAMMEHHHQVCSKSSILDGN